jgi:hypothetical protein
VHGPVHDSGKQSDGAMREGGNGGSDDSDDGLPLDDFENLKAVLDDGDTHINEELIVGSDMIRLNVM